MIEQQLVFHHEQEKHIIPYYTYSGKKLGKHIVISGGMHGDEINGIMLCRHIQQYFNQHNIEEQLIGTITIIPILNIRGFDSMDRYVPIDGRDLNRSFGVTDGSFSSLYAQFLLDTIYKNADHGLDIHDAGTGGNILPHARIHACDDGVCLLCTRQMGKWFSSNIVIERKGNDHMLAVYSNNKFNIPISTIEIGGDNTPLSNLFPRAIDGILAILGGLEYITNKEPITEKKQFLSHRTYYKAKSGAVVEYVADLGIAVQKGDIIARIYYPYNDKKEDIIAEKGGIVFSSYTKNKQIAIGNTIISTII